MVTWLERHPTWLVEYIAPEISEGSASLVLRSRSTLVWVRFWIRRVKGQCHKTRKCLSVDLRFVSAGVLSPSSWKRCLSRFFGATWSNRRKNRPVKQKPKGSKGKKISPAFYRLSLKRWRSGVVTRGGERNTRTGSAEWTTFMHTLRIRPVRITQRHFNAKTAPVADWITDVALRRT